jgi:hypothetical protein
LAPSAPGISVNSASLPLNPVKKSRPATTL